MALIGRIKRNVQIRTSKREQGLALVLVLSLIGVILSMLAEVLFESEVISRASVGERDRVRAEMAAVTGAQLALFFIELEAKLKNLKNNQSIPAGVRKMVEDTEGDLEKQMGGRKLSQLLNDFPIGSQGFESIESFAQLNLSKLADEKLIGALQAVPGYFVVHTSDESSKLNLNFLADRSLSKHMRNALIRIFSMVREKDFLERFGLEPERLASNIEDYIDSDNKDSMESSDEGGPYAQLKFKHGPKNGPLESVEELRRIPGFHYDDVYNVFSPYFTVWPMQADQHQWNIHAAPNELVAALTTPAGNEVNDPLMDRFEDKLADGEKIGKQDRRDFSAFLKEGGITDRTTEDILRWLAGFESNVYRIRVRGVSNQVERNFEMIAVYEVSGLGDSVTGKENAEDGQNGDQPGNGDAEEDPGDSEESGDEDTGDGGQASSESETEQKQAQQGKIRVVYQRFL